MKQSQDFTRGKLFGPMLRFAMPTLAAMFLQTMYGAVDMMIVGQFATPADASAISTGSWAMHLLTSFIMGLAMGTTVLLGRKLGEGRPQEAGKIIGVSIRLFAIISIVFTLVLAVFTPSFLDLLKIPPEARSAAIDYVRICSLGTVFIVAYNLLGSIFRGLGNSTVPLVTVSIACVTNIVVDYILVAIFNMAAAGAAIATVAAQCLSVVLSLLMISRQKLPFRLRRQDFSRDTAITGAILRLGIPAALQGTLVNMSFLVITAIVNSLGVIISAGVGVAEKLCGFVLLAPSAFSQTMTSVVSQNMGAGQPDRARKALRYGIGTSFAVGAVMAYLTFFHGDILAAIFSRDSQVIQVSAQYLKAYAVDTLLVSVMFCMNGYFNGCGHTTFSMAQGIIGAFLVRVPVAYLMSQVVPVNVLLIGLATPASSLLQTVLCIGYYILLRSRERRVPA